MLSWSRVRTQSATWSSSGQTPACFQPMNPSGGFRNSMIPTTLLGLPSYRIVYSLIQMSPFPIVRRDFDSTLGTIQRGIRRPHQRRGS